MKNIAVLSVLVIIFGVCSYAEENERNYGFSLGPQFGFVYGQTMEYVYPVGEIKNEVLSELLWDMKPVFYFGIQGEFSRVDLMKAPGFFSSFSFKVGFPADSGVMEDRDWQSTENNALTNYSRHTNKTNTYNQLDATVGASFPIKSLLYIKPFISSSWMRFSFSARDGYGVYARERSINSHIYYPIEYNPDKYNFSGTVIRYQQDWLILATGLTAGTKIFYPFSFEVSFKISPFTYCSATDNHLLGNTVFKDYTAWGLFLEPSIEMSFAAKPLDLSLGAGYRHIGKTKGNSYANHNDLNYIKGNNKAGAGLSLWDFNFLVSFRP